MLTGANGQVAREIDRLAPSLGIGIDAFDRARLDLAVRGRASALLAEGGYDGVINAAAYTGVDAAESDVETAVAVNSAAPGELARACAQAGIPLVHYSTDYVFDGSGRRPLVESDPTGPLGVYGRTKLDGENAVRSTACNHAIIRLSWVFSAHGKNFVKTMLRLGRERDALSVVDDQVGTPTPASAAAQAGLVALSAIAKEPAFSGIYHFAGDEAVSWAGFAEAIFEEAGLDVRLTRISTEDYPTPARRPAYSVLESGKFAKTFGLPAPNWRAGLKTVIQETKAQAIL